MTVSACFALDPEQVAPVLLEGHGLVAGLLTAQAVKVFDCGYPRNAERLADNSISTSQGQADVTTLIPVDS